MDCSKALKQPLAVQLVDTTKFQPTLGQPQTRNLRSTSIHILITGASSGIGESIAREYGSNPDHLITLVARRKDKLVALADSLQAQTLVVPCDLSALENVPATVQLAVDQFGPVDMLVNNAGMNCFQRRGPT